MKKIRAMPSLIFAVVLVVFVSSCVLPVNTSQNSSGGISSGTERRSGDIERFCSPQDEEPIKFGDALKEAEDAFFGQSKYLQGQKDKRDVEFISRVVIEEIFRLKGVVPQDIPQDVWDMQEKAFFGEDINFSFLNELHQGLTSHSYYGELYKRRSLDSLPKVRALYRELASVLFQYAGTSYPDWADSMIDSWAYEQGAGKFEVLAKIFGNLPEAQQNKAKDVRKRRDLHRDFTKTFFRHMQIGVIPQWALFISRENTAPFNWNFMDNVVSYLAAQPGNEGLAHYSQQENLLEAAIQGLLRAIGDPFGWYDAPSEVAHESFKQGVDGFYTGFGFVLDSTKDGEIYLSNVIQGGAAKEAGLKIGDIIRAIDKKTLKGCSMFGISAGLRGDAGTGLTFTVFRPDASETLDIFVERKVIRLLEVGSWPNIVLEGGRATGDLLSYDFPLKDSRGERHSEIAYIKIKSFSRQVSLDLKDILESFNWNNIKGLIIDVRENPGGYSEAVASFFLKPGTKILERDDGRGGRISEYAPTGGFMFNPKVWDAIKFPIVPSYIPIVVLIDYNSASASEVLAAALQENGRALLVGGRTIGKGTSTGSVLLGKNGKYGQVNMATGFWYTPSGKHIESLRDKEDGGLAPDISVTFSVEDKRKQARDPSYDPQLFRAIEELGKTRPTKWAWGQR